MDTLLESYFPRTNPKSRLFQNVKEVPTIGIPKIGRVARFMEFQKYGLFLHRCRFLEFHLYNILIQFSYLLNSKNRHLFQNFRFVYFQEYFLFLKWTDFWNSNSGIASLPIPFSLLSKSGLIQYAMNNLTFYPVCKELVGYLFHFFHILSKKLWRSAIH